MSLLRQNLLGRLWLRRVRARFSNTLLGSRGEDFAERFLRRRGLAILARNYRCRCGEIDIIARDGGVTVFVEVKGRSGEMFGDALESVTAAKRKRIARAAEHFLAANRLQEGLCRFDVVGIRWKDGARPEAVHIRDAFRINR